MGGLHDIHPALADPALCELGYEQLFAILGLDPISPNPGESAIAARRSLLVRHSNFHVQNDDRVPVTMERLNLAYDALTMHYDKATDDARRYSQRWFWNLDFVDTPNFATLFRPYVARIGGIANESVARISLSDYDMSSASNVEHAGLFELCALCQLRGFTAR